MKTSRIAKLPKGRNYWEDAVDVAIFDARGVRRYDASPKYWGLNSARDKNTFLPYDSVSLTDAAVQLFTERSNAPLGSLGIQLDGWEAVALCLAGHLTKDHFERATETSSTICLSSVNIYGIVRDVTIVAHTVPLFEKYTQMHYTHSTKNPA